jgi:cell pole-organizing protein PopZ
MTSSARAQEPTMEEILASIRRIIADDDPAASAKPAAATQPQEDAPEEPAPAPAAHAGLNGHAPPRAGAPMPAAPAPKPPAEDVLELTDPVSAPEAPPPGGFTDLEFRESGTATTAAPFTGVPFAGALFGSLAAPPAAPRDAHSESLLSAAADSAVAGAFGSLSNTILTDNARTLEDVVRDMLRPMLKSWLDDNLPAIVERLVRAEIERVSRGRR